MGRTIIICEKPSVAREYIKYLKLQPKEKTEGYTEGFCQFMNTTVAVTWTIGHLCTLSYPEVYDPALKRWSLDVLPFLPEQYRYEVISSVAKQFNIVKKLYNSKDIDAIYYAGDSGREGIYIQMLVRQIAGHKPGIVEKVVWIDSQTEREILKGIRDAKGLDAYQHLIDAAYARAIEDYAVGINFSRALSCKYGQEFNNRIASSKWSPIAVGRVMTCVLSMVVQREREIRNFVETPFYKVAADTGFETEWKADEQSSYYGNPTLYNESGFKARENAEYLLNTLEKTKQLTVKTAKVSEEKKAAPLLYNLAEAQFDCSKKYKLSPDQTLDVIQSLYEKKLVTYPRTDARVLSSAVAGEISINLNGLVKLGYKKDMVMRIAQNGWHKGLEKTHYVDDSKITDHYAIIPTGNIEAVSSLSDLELNIYHDIIDRFLCIFYPKAVYTKAEVVLEHPINERFYGSVKTLKDPGYLVVIEENPEVKENICAKLSVGQVLPAQFSIKEGKTTAPKRYSSGSMILAMENAGKMIEDEELREQIKGCGIGTSATRGEVLKKLVKIGYLCLNAKTQILTSSHTGETVYDIVDACCSEMLSPEMTAHWEQGLSKIEDGSITKEKYLGRMENYIREEVEQIKSGQSIQYTQDAKAKAPSAKDDNVTCPLCGKGHIFEGKKSYSCSEYKSGCKFTIWKEISGKQISWANAKKLIAGETTPVIKGFKKKDGSGTFDAALKMEDGRVKFVFQNSGKKKS